jgi:hypothetical protein
LKQLIDLKNMRSNSFFFWIKLSLRKSRKKAH